MGAEDGHCRSRDNFMSQTQSGLTDDISEELCAVEQRFHEELLSDFSCVSTLIKHVSRFRGKRLRPTLVLLSGKATGGINDAHVIIATVVEMVHMATLVHDDVLDEAELRRKGATLNHLRGNEAAVLLGDYLISHSYHLCSSLNSQSASRQIARTTNQLCEGELLQIENRNNLKLDEQTYFRIITRKTAVLCGTCCRLGAELAGAPKEIADAMETYGISLGIAFQIQDDVLDLVGDVRQVGKTLGSDLEKCKLTLPLIHFRDNAPPEHRALLLSLLSGPDPDRVEKIRNLILPSDSLSYARQMAEHYVAKARAALKPLPDTSARRTLRLMADFVITRPM
jgi:octaprenyl-diphosphate synthase